MKKTIRVIDKTKLSKTKYYTIDYAVDYESEFKTIPHEYQTYEKAKQMIDTLIFDLGISIDNIVLIEHEDTTSMLHITEYFEIGD